MIWLVRVYLFFMTLIYLWIGIWAILDPFFQNLNLGYSSFLNVIGLSVTSPLGHSEIAGLYGGLNFCIGLMCLIGIFKANIGIFSLKFITFLVGSIAFGRIMSSLLLMNQDFFNTYFIFEIFAFIAGITLINLQKKLN